MYKPKIFLAKDLLEIKNSVARAEKKCRAEIVPYISAQADPYWEGHLIVALVSLLIALLLYFYIAPWRNIAGVLWSEVAGFLVGILLARLFPRLRIFFLEQKQISQTTRARAVRAFYEHGLSQTRGRTGVLIALFLLEKRVEVVTDEAVSKKYSQEAWDKVVELIVADAKKHRLKAGFIKGITECANILSKKMPRRQKKTRNELQDDLVAE